MVILKRLSVGLGVFILSLFLSISISTKVYAAYVDDDIPSGALYFDESGNLKNTTVSNLFSQILIVKQTTIIDEITRSVNALAGQSNNQNTFSGSITGDLDLERGGSLWGQSPSELKARFQNAKEGSVFYLRQGNAKYRFYVPRGKKTITKVVNGKTVTEEVTVNEAFIDAAIQAIERYKTAVKEAILAGALQSSVDVFSMYPDKQVPVLDILENVTTESGSYRKIKNSVNNVTISYSLDYHYNLLFGKMNGSDLLAPEFSWSSKLKDIKITPGTDGNIGVMFSEDFIRFIQPNSQERQTLSPIDNVNLVSVKRPPKFKTSYSLTTVEPRSMVDSAMRLIVPSTFDARIDNNTYVVKDTSGYKLVPGVRLHLPSKQVYGDEEGSLKLLGNYDAFGIDERSLVFFYTYESSQSGGNARKVGAVIPLWYKEAIYDTRMNTVYLTGRKIKFRNDYSGKIRLDELNRELFSAEEKVSGDIGVPLRHFAFFKGSDYKLSGDHAEIGIKPDSFQVHIDFLAIDTSSGDEDIAIKGFVIYRNNFYLDDPDLILWLSSDAARALADVKAEELYKLLTGELSVSPSKLTYSEWLRLQEIRAELDAQKRNFLMSFIRVITIVFGVLLIIYSTLLFLAYFIDIFNPLNIPILKFLTFGRLYAVTKSEKEYLTPPDGKVKYVSFWDIFKIYFVGIAIGIVFLYHDPVIEFLVWTYDKVTSWAGVL